MPCDQVRTFTYGFTKVKPQLFADALKAAGLSVNFTDGVIRFAGTLPDGRYVAGTWEGGDLDLRQEDFDSSIQNALRVAYSTHVVQLAYKKSGWAMKQTQSTVPGARAFEVTKRGF